MCNLLLPPNWTKQVERVSANPTVDEINTIKAELISEFKDTRLLTTT